MTFYRVSPTGSDASLTGSFSAPWQTLGKLADVFTQDKPFVGGDIIVIDPGVTHDSSGVPLLFSGNDFASKVKIIMGGGGLGDKPEITGNDTDIGVTISNVTNLQISDWVIRNANDYGLATNLVTDIVIHGFEIKDIIGTGIGFSYYDQDLDEGRDFIVEHCYVHDTTGDGTTSISAIRTQVRYCHFKNHGIGQASNLVDGVAFHGVKKDFCEVHHCIIENVEGKSGIGANFNGALVEYTGYTWNINASAQTIEKSGGPAWWAGYSVGDYFKVTSAEDPENDGIYLIAEIISTHKVRVSTDVPWTTETQYTQGFTTTNAADATANVMRMDGSRVYSHHNYLRNVCTQGINSLEPLSVCIAINNIIVMPDRWFGRPFVNASLVFTSGANTVRIVGEDWTTKFSVGDLVYFSGTSNDGLYKIASFSSNPDPNDTMLIVTAAPGIRDPAYDTSVSTTESVTGTVEYAVPFNTGCSGFYNNDGLTHAFNNTVYNMSRSEDPGTITEMVASIALTGSAGGEFGSGVLYNNVSVCTQDESCHLIWDVDYPGGTDYGCYWPDDLNPTGLGRFYALGFSFAQLATWQDLTPLDTNSIAADPQFIGDPSADPRYAALSATSPCIGAGSDLSANATKAFNDDYRGRPRPDGAWDIGAMQAGVVDYPSIRTNRVGAHLEFQIVDSGCVGLRLAVTYEEGAGVGSAGVLLYRVMKPADYASNPAWQKAEITAGVVMLSRMLDVDSTYIVEAVVGRVRTKVDGRVEFTNVERFREPEDNYSDFGPCGSFVEISAVVADVGAAIQPVDWSALVADPFNVLLIGTQPEDGVVIGPSGERLDDGVQRHYASLVCAAVAQDMTTPRRLNVLTTAYSAQRITDLQFPHLFADGTTVASLADYGAGVGRLSTGELVARAQHQSEPASAGALFGRLTLLRTYEPDPHLVVFALGAADMAEYDPTDSTWESTAATDMAALITDTLTGYDHMPRVVVVLPPVSGPVNTAGEDVVRKALSDAVAAVIASGVTSLDVGLVDLLADAALAAQNLEPWDIVPTRDQHAWLGRSGGAFDTAVRAAFAHVLP